MWHLTDPRERRLFLLLCGAYGIFGASFTVIGAAVPQIIRGFGWTYTVTGLVLAASALGYFLSTYLCGYLVRRFTSKAVLVTGLAVGAAAMSLFARTDSPWVNFLLGFAIGTCQASIEVVTNLELIHMEREGQSRLMNLAHSFFAVGAIVGPAFVGLLSGGSMSGSVWVFAVTGGLAALMALLFSFAPFPRVAEARALGGGEQRAVLLNPFLLLLSFYLLLYVGVELGVSVWVSEYFVRILGTTPSFGAFGVSILWAGLLAGRLVISFAYHGHRQEWLMLWLALLCTAALAAMFVVSSPLAVAACVFFTGLGFSGLYPLAMVVAGRSFRSSIAVGAVVTGGGVGSFTFPFIMAIFAQKVGIRGGFLFILCVSAFLVVLSFALVRRGLRARGPNSARGAGKNRGPQGGRNPGRVRPPGSATSSPGG